MSYSEDFRKRTIEYREEGHTLEETSKTFKVSITTIRKWEKQLSEEGNLKAKIPRRSFKKIDPDKLRKYIEENPDAYLREIAKEFGCCISAVNKALKRLKITRKKRLYVIRSRTPKKLKNMKKK